MILSLPTRAFTFRGQGTGRMKLGAFHAALVAAGVGGYNLLTLTSILPAHCRIVDRRVVIGLVPGHIVPCVLSETTRPRTLASCQISAGIAIARSLAADMPGLIIHAEGVGDEDFPATLLHTLDDVKVNAEPYDQPRLVVQEADTAALGGDAPAGFLSVVAGIAFVG